jgi:hypothetical protein
LVLALAVYPAGMRASSKPVSRRNTGRAQRSVLLQPAPAPPAHAFVRSALFAIAAAHAILLFPFTPSLAAFLAASFWASLAALLAASFWASLAALLAASFWTSLAALLAASFWASLAALLAASFWASLAALLAASFWASLAALLAASFRTSLAAAVFSAMLPISVVGSWLSNVEPPPVVAVQMEMARQPPRTVPHATMVIVIKPCNYMKIHINIRIVIVLVIGGRVRKTPPCRIVPVIGAASEAEAERNRGAAR